MEKTKQKWTKGTVITEEKKIFLAARKDYVMFHRLNETTPLWGAWMA